jgi:hypothetical protein
VLTMQEIEDKIAPYRVTLPARTRKYIHYRSICNFLLHYHEIKTEHAKAKINALLSDYISEIEDNDFEYRNGGDSRVLVRKFLWNLASYYKEDCNFMEFIGFKFLVVIGVLGDGLLYFTGLNSAIHRIPIVTISLVLYHMFIVLVKAPQGRVYGLFY